MKRYLGVRSLIAAVTLVAGLAGLLAALPSAEAMPEGVCTYYSSAKKNRTVVGQRGTGCCGEVIHWGVTSAYRECHTVYCLDVWCPPPEI